MPLIKEGYMTCKTHKKQQIDDLAAWIENTILEFCRTSPENTLKNAQNDRAYDDPLVGFANGGDPLFEDLKKDIGPPFMTPIEIFRTSFPGLSCSTPAPMMPQRTINAGIA
jgi:epoxyqueuosine reductase